MNFGERDVGGDGPQVAIRLSSVACSTEQTIHVIRQAFYRLY